MISAIRPSLLSETRVAAANASATSAIPATTACHRNSAGAAEQAAAEPSHAVKPAVVVIRLAAEVLADLGVRQDQKPLGRDALDHRVRDGFGLQRTRGHEIKAGLAAASQQHVGPHSLGAQTRDADSVVAVRDREPLEE